MADRLEFNERVGDAQQGGRAGKQFALEIGPQAIAEHRDAGRVGDPGELPDLLVVRNCASSTSTQASGWVRCDATICS